MSKPRLLDLFCGAGGAAMGYHRAGFEVMGVDINPQPHFPFKFHQADAMTYPLEGFDAIHASPPCQAYSIASARWRNSGEREYPDLLEPTRQRLVSGSVPYVIENVEGARKRMCSPMRLCGQSFGIGVVRHRLFETNWLCLSPVHSPCVGAVTRDLVSVTGPPGRFYRAVTVAGHGGNSRSFKLSTWREAMGIDWMTRDELTQAIPPAYTEYIGKQLMAALGGDRD
jgi:DNA (cytosine-5)-methyltransferase 1